MTCVALQAPFCHDLNIYEHKVALVHGVGSLLYTHKHISGCNVQHTHGHGVHCFESTKCHVCIYNAPCVPTSFFVALKSCCAASYCEDGRGFFFKFFFSFTFFGRLPYSRYVSLTCVVCSREREQKNCKPFSANIFLLRTYAINALTPAVAAVDARCTRHTPCRMPFDMKCNMHVHVGMLEATFCQRHRTEHTTESICETWIVHGTHGAMDDVQAASGHTHNLASRTF